MFTLKFNIFITLAVLFIFISNTGMTEEQQYSPEMIANCLKLSEGIDTSDWVIDEDKTQLNNSKLNALDDGWNKQIKEARKKTLEACGADKESDACWSAKIPERKLIIKRFSCYYALLMKAI